MKTSASIGVLFALSVAACGGSPVYGEKSMAQIRAEGDADRTREATMEREASQHLLAASTATKQIETTQKCDAASVRTITSSAAGIEDSGTYFQDRAARLPINLKMWQMEKAIKLGMAASGIRLDGANALLKAGCYDDADGLYRSVISIYTGDRYARQRELARMGVDDVREKRRGK